MGNMHDYKGFNARDRDSATQPLTPRGAAWEVPASTGAVYVCTASYTSPPYTLGYTPVRQFL